LTPRKEDFIIHGITMSDNLFAPQPFDEIIIVRHPPVSTLFNFNGELSVSDPASPIDGEGVAHMINIMWAVTKKDLSYGLLGPAEIGVVDAIFSSARVRAQMGASVLLTAGLRSKRQPAGLFDDEARKASKYLRHGISTKQLFITEETRPSLRQGLLKNLEEELFGIKRELDMEAALWPQGVVIDDRLEDILDLDRKHIGSSRAEFSRLFDETVPSSEVVGQLLALLHETLSPLPKEVTRNRRFVFVTHGGTAVLMRELCLNNLRKITMRTYFDLKHGEPIERGNVFHAFFGRGGNLLHGETMRLIPQEQAETLDPKKAFLFLRPELAFD
jgi:hypothetical protein